MPLKADQLWNLRAAGQGPDAATYGARAAVIGGCTSTSNLQAASQFNIPRPAQWHMPGSKASLMN